MSRVTFNMPPALEALDQRVFDSGVRALELTSEETVTLAKRDPNMAVATGATRRGLSRSPVRSSASTLRVDFVVPGQIGRGAAAIEGGRRAGARGPSPAKLQFAPGFRDAAWNDLAAMKNGGWVWRKCRDQVLQKADELAMKYFTKWPQGRRGVKRPTKDYFVACAMYVVAASKAAAVHDLGITPRRFLARHMPTFRLRFRIRFIQQLRSRVNEVQALGRAPRDERSTG